MSSKSGSQELYKISEVSRICGVTLRALRFYETRGMLQPVRRGKARFYDHDQITRLRLIVKGKQLGFTLTEIARMLDDHSTVANKGREFAIDRETLRSQLHHLEQRRAEIDLAIQELREDYERRFGRAAEKAVSASPKIGH